MAETLNRKGGYVDWRPKLPLNGGLHPFWEDRKPPITITGKTVAVRSTKIPQLPEIDTTNFINRALAHQQQDDRQRDLVSVCCTNGACPNHERTYQANVYSAPSLALDQTTEEFVGPCVTCDEWTIVKM